MTFLVPVPNTTNGDILYGGLFYYDNASPYLYTILVTGSSVTLTSTAQTANTNFEPVWVDPTGTWLFTATFNFSANEAETLTQYQIGSGGSLTVGPEGTFNINGSGVGGVTNSSAGYISSTGMVLIPTGGGGYSLSYNSITGSLDSPVKFGMAGADGNAAFLP